MRGPRIIRLQVEPAHLDALRQLTHRLQNERAWMSASRQLSMISAVWPPVLASATFAPTLLFVRALAPEMHTTTATLLSAGVACVLMALYLFGQLAAIKRCAETNLVGTQKLERYLCDVLSVAEALEGDPPLQAPTEPGARAVH